MNVGTALVDDLGVSKIGFGSGAGVVVVMVVADEMADEGVIV